MINCSPKLTVKIPKSLQTKSKITQEMKTIAGYFAVASANYSRSKKRK